MEVPSPPTSTEVHSPSISPLMQFSNGPQDDQIQVNPTTVAPQGDPNTPVSYNMVWASQQHYFIASASPHPPHSTDTYMYPPTSGRSRSRHPPADAYLLASSSSPSSNDRARMGHPHGDHANCLTTAHSANAPVSPHSPL